jgi:hypothetical protein
VVVVVVVVVVAVAAKTNMPAWGSTARLWCHFKIRLYDQFSYLVAL